nr:PREDICTED: uncharacterized protein LOC109037819 [Bemisia tabaci]
MENDFSSGDKISNPAPISSPVASSTPTSRSKPNLNISSNTEEESDPNSKNVTAERILTVNSTRNSSRSNVSPDTNTSNGSSTMEDSDVFGENAVNGNWVQAVLTKSSDGRGVLKWYKDRGSLVARKRNTLVKIIIDKELDIDPSVGIKGERFEALARAIVALFPTECSETYYIPRHVDTLQKVKPARGKLYDRWINKRRQLRSEGIICKDKQSIDEPSEEIVRDAEALEPEISKAIELLKLYEQLDEDAQNALAISLHARISLFSASKVHDISKYLESYPLLAQTEGYRLIHADFARLHPEKAQALYHNWSNFAFKITKYAADLLPITQTFKKQVQILNIDLTLEDEKNRDLNALYLLSLLLPALTVKRNWKPSKIECKDAFFLQRSTIQEAADKLRQRERQLKANNIPPQPTPVLIGSAHSREVYVCIGNVLYKVGSVLGAVDICCKLFMTLKTELPPDCILPWLFIIAFIYGVDAGNQAVKYPSLTTLKKDIGL